MLWPDRAEIAQESLTHFFADRWRVMRMAYPPERRETFNYWWLAHVVDARVDAYLRSGSARWLDEARRVAHGIRRRNRLSLYNGYFDDMLWYALALERLHRASGDAWALRDARLLWLRAAERGWNDTHGESLAWRTRQLDYKNTPANGPFAILSARLGALDHARRAFAWIDERMRGADALVRDGVNRTGDGAVDEWIFTYNQGLYLGAAVALHEATGDDAPLHRAVETAHAAVAALAPGGVFAGEDGGGDAGLFRGVFYRYAGQLLRRVDDAPLAAFVRGSTDALWEHGTRGPWLLAGDDWRRPAETPVTLATELSAVMAVEMRAALEAPAGRSAG